MNPTIDAPSPPAGAGPAPATVLLHFESTWSGLASTAEQIGVPLDATAIARFERYRDLLLERNEQVNLTAIRHPDEVERRLFVDALALIPAIDSFAAQRSRGHYAPIRLIDIGSGAGFPGLALKIARPDLDVTLVDATAKKVAFIADVIKDLDLQSVRAVHGRAEELGRDPALRERFDIATARAVASLPVLLEFVVPFLDVAGQAFLPKGQQIDVELKAGRRAAIKLGAEILGAEDAPYGKTRIVAVRKNTLTARAYPRRIGIPAQSPLGGGS